MPWEVRKKGDLWGIFNLQTKRFSSKRFKTKVAADNMIKVWKKWESRMRKHACF